MEALLPLSSSDESALAVPTPADVVTPPPGSFGEHAERFVQAMHALENLARRGEISEACSARRAAWLCTRLVGALTTAGLDDLTAAGPVAVQALALLARWPYRRVQSQTGPKSRESKV